jgi:hypothetical protein
MERDKEDVTDKAMKPRGYQVTSSSRSVSLC